ncbi:hypothetical protein Scinn_56810 [Streptomyces virginiae]|uniref:biotin synthase n=1 Tax=Streptomyces virginiae TaxID=1961 RepID=A0ABQ3NTW0_STRVG|nr:hypothetical protein Scinn_56810 [Streptomyces virginiae]
MFGRRVKLNYLVNLKSGLCPEDCSYCSQRLGSKAEILKYTWLKPEEASQAAAAGVAGGAKRVCLVASGRGPTDRDVERVGKTIEAIKEQNEGIEVCACLGLLSDGQAEKLREAGAGRLQPQPEHLRGHLRPDHQDPHLRRPRGHRGEGARGGPVGLLRPDRGHGRDRRGPRRRGLPRCASWTPTRSRSTSLIPFEGTPLAKEWNLTPQRCLRILAMARFVCPDVEVRLGGRARGAPALAAAAGAEHRQLDLPG